MENSKELTGWVRLLLAVVIASITALLLSWFLAPRLSTLFAKYMGYDTQIEIPKALLFVDLVLSTIFFFLGSLLSIKLAKSRPYIAAFGVSVIGWAVYFSEVGGLNGMLHSEYPLWYEFFPSHFGSGWVAASILAIQQANPSFKRTA